MIYFELGDLVVFNNYKGIWHEEFTNCLGKVVGFGYDDVLIVEKVLSDVKFTLQSDQFYLVKKDSKLLRLIL